MPFVFDCPVAEGACDATFDVTTDALAHAETAHPGAPLAAPMLPGRFVSHAEARGVAPLRLFRCRRCATQIETRDPDHGPLCGGCQTGDAQRGEEVPHLT